MKVASRMLTGALLLAAPAAFAQTSVINSTVPITVNIYKGLTLTQNSGLVFGNIVTSSGGGNAIMSPGGGLSYTGGITSAPGGTPSAATFTVAGTDTQLVNIIIPSAPVTLNGSGIATGHSITATTFTSSASGGSTNGGQVTLSGATPFGVGATIGIAASQADGPYGGTFAVTVAYN